jgi:hypothetical protein
MNNIHGCYCKFGLPKVHAQLTAEWANPTSQTRGGQNRRGCHRTNVRGHSISSEWDQERLPVSTLRMQSLISFQLLESEGQVEELDAWTLFADFTLGANRKLYRPATTPCVVL